MADVVYRPEFDDKDLLAALQRLEQTSDQVEKTVSQLGARASKSMRDVAESTKGVEDEMQKVVREAIETDKALDKVGESGEKAGGAMKGLKKGFADAVQDIKIGSKSIREWRSQLEKTAEAQKKAEGSTKGLGGATGKLGKVFGVLKAAIPLAILGGLIKVLKSSEKATKFFERATAGLSAGWKTLVKNIENGDFKGLGRDVLSAAQAAFEAQRRFQDLQNTIRGMNVAYAAAQRESAAYRAVLDDETASMADRMKAAEDIAIIEDFYARRRINNARENLQILEAQKASEDEIADARIQLIQTEAELEQVQRDRANNIARLQMERSQRIDEERKRVEALLREYTKLTEQLSGQAAQARLSVLGELDRALAERENAIEEVAKLRQRIIDEATAGGFQVPDDLDEDVAAIVAAIEKEFQKEIDRLRGEGMDPVSQLVTINDPANIQSRIGQTIKEIGLGVETAATDTDILSAFDSLKNKILETFGLTEEQGAFLVDQFKTVYDSVAAITQANIQREIEQQDALIDARQKRVDELKDQLKEEQDAQKNGLANNVDQLQEALKQEQAVIQAAEQRRLQLEQEAARKRLIADSIQQASQLSLAAAKVISSEAGKGLPGIILAAAGIGLLFSIIAKAKAQAKSFSAVPKFREGTKFEGPSHEQGGIPLLVGSAQGYRAIEVEGGEHLIGTAPSREHDRFLTNLNARKYDGMPLYQIAEAARRSQVIPYARSVQKSSEAFAQARERRNFELMEKAFRDEIRALGDRFERQLNKMPTAYDPTKPVTFRFPNDERKTERR